MYPSAYAAQQQVIQDKKDRHQLRVPLIPAIANPRTESDNLEMEVQRDRFLSELSYRQDQARQSQAWQDQVRQDQARQDQAWQEHNPHSAPRKSKIPCVLCGCFKN